MELKHIARCCSVVARHCNVGGRHCYAVARHCQCLLGIAWWLHANTMRLLDIARSLLSGC